jgi:hypothetical protein
MLLVERIGFGDHLVVPAVVAGLVAAEEEDGNAARVEGIENAVRSTLVLDAKFAHMAEPAYTIK